MKKRAQVTIFVIIGLVILLSTFFIFYIRSKMLPPDDVEVNKDPVQKYIEQCLADVSAEAVILAGQQGGYIEIPEAVKLQADLDPFGSVLGIFQRQYMPYWLYQDGQGLDATEMPDLHKSYEEDYSIQWQLERYIAKNVKECLDFSFFDARGLDIVETGGLSADVLVTEASVNVRLNYPLQLHSSDGSVDVRDEFFAQLPIRLGRIYRLAKEIRDYELQTVFLERTTMNLISLNSKIDDEYLPPMYGGLHFEPCSDTVFWLHQDVEENFEEVLAANIPFLRVADTATPAIEISGSIESDSEIRELRQGVYDNMRHQVSDNYYPYISTEFWYPGNLDLRIGNRGLLQPLSYQMDLIFASVCMFEYQFAYNVKYPVVISLTDEKSVADKQDYLFQFPMQVVLKQNYPRVRYADFNDVMEIPEAKSECDPKYRLSGQYQINVVEGRNGIDRANIYYQCGPSSVYEFHDNGTIKGIEHFADRCFIGTAELGILETRLPQCVGGALLTIEAPGYLKRTEIIGDTLEEDRTLTFALDKVHNLDVDVRKFTVKPPSEGDLNPDIILDTSGSVQSCSFNDDSNSLQSYEQALIRLEKLDPENGELMTPAIAFYLPNNDSTINIAAGSYRVDAMLFRNERFNGEMTIRSRSQSRTIPGGIGKSDEIVRYPDENILLPKTISGGAFYEWNVTNRDLQGATSITFYVTDEGAPTIIESIGSPMIHREACSNQDHMRPVIR